MNSSKSNSFSIFNSEPFIKYAISFVLIAIVSKMFLYKQIKRAFKRLFNKQSKLKKIIESEKTNSTDLYKYLRESIKFKNVYNFLKKSENEEEAEFKNQIIPEGLQDIIFSEILIAKENIAQNSDEKLKLKSALKLKFNNHNKIAGFRNYLKSLYSEKFNKNNSGHVKMLFEIWRKLKGNETQIELIDRKWLDIGFQGPDPSTDFRGAGILALYNLHDFVINREAASRKVYLDATDKIKWYFFAASGVNISGAIIDIVENGKVDEMILNYLRKNDSAQIENFLNDIYETIFFGFNDYWNKQSSFDFMNFNTLFQKYINQDSIKEIYTSLNK